MNNHRNLPILAISIVAILTACGERNPEEKYEDAVSELRQARDEQQQALKGLEQKQAKLERLKQDLDKAQKDASKARSELNERLARVEQTATAQVLFHELQKKMVNDKQFPNSAIRVTVTDGNVQLDGWVRTEKMRKKAVDMAKNQPGVKSVKNNLIIYTGEGAPPESMVTPAPANPAAR